MTREEQLKFCTKCTHRQMDMKQGMLCDLTNAKADFEGKCENFNVDQHALEKEMLIERETQASEGRGVSENPHMNGASWFAWIGILSLLNIVLEYTDVRFIFGLGITSIFSAWLGTIGIGLAILTSIFYILVYVLASKKELEWAYKLGYYAYLSDAIILLTLLFKDNSLLVDNLFHWGLLLVLYFRHPFYSKEIRSKAKVEKWTVGRIITTIVMSLVIVTSAALSVMFVKGQESKLFEREESIEMMVSETNQALPVDLGDGVIWEKIYIEGQTCYCVYKNINEDVSSYSQDELEIAAKMWKNSVYSNSEEFKSDPLVISCIKHHYGITFKYHDKNNKNLYTIDFTPEELELL